MAKDVLEHLASTATFALAKALDNVSFCQNFMGLMGRTIWESHQNGKDIFKVKIGSIDIVGNELRAKVEYGYDGTVQDIGMLGRVDGMREFVGKRSENMVKVLAKNPTYLRFLNDAVIKLQDYAIRKGKRFSDLEIVRGFISNENVLVMVLG